MTSRMIFAVSLFYTITLATPVKKCSKQSCLELADAQELSFSVQSFSNGAPSGCLRYNDGRMIWVEGCSGPQCGTTNCNGCSVMDTLCGAEEAGCDAYATKKGNWCMCQPGFRMNRGDNGKPLGGWPMQYHWNARNTDGFKCVPDEEYITSYLATSCGLEGGNCPCEGTVLYGRGGNVAALLDDDYVVKTDVTGNVRCTNEEFGDPTWGVRKRCICITGKRCDPNATKQGNWCKCNKHYRMNRNSNGKPYGGWNDRYHFNGVGATVNVCVVDPNNPPAPNVVWTVSIESNHAGGSLFKNDQFEGRADSTFKVMRANSDTYDELLTYPRCVAGLKDCQARFNLFAYYVASDDGACVMTLNCHNAGYKNLVSSFHFIPPPPEPLTQRPTAKPTPAPTPSPTESPTAQDCEHTPWSDWGECSEECGGGQQGRVRTIEVQPTEDGLACGHNSETRPCNQEACPTQSPTLSPSMAPSLSPTYAPTLSPSMAPSLSPTYAPTYAPTASPTSAYEFTLRGETGEEKVMLMGEIIQLSKPLNVGVDEGRAVLAYIGGGSGVILEFAPAYMTHVVMPNFYGSSRCSSTEERCDVVTDGHMKATGIYFLEFLRSPVESSSSVGSK